MNASAATPAELLAAFAHDSGLCLVGLDAELRLATGVHALAGFVGDAGDGPVPGQPLIRVGAFAPAAPRIEVMLSRALAGESCTAIEELALAGGSLRQVEVSTFPLRLGNALVNGVGLALRDVTGRVRHESSHQFLADLERDLLLLEDAEEIPRHAMRSLCEHLEGGRCAFAEIDTDNDSYLRWANYSRDVPTPPGHSRLGSYGSHLHQRMMQGEVIVIEDAALDSVLDDVAREALRQRGSRSTLIIPLRRGGRTVAILGMHCRLPRRWRSDEVELLFAVGGRCLEALERVRSDRSLHESLDLLRGITHGSRTAICALDRQLRYTMSNEAYQGIVRYLYGTEAVVGSSLLDVTAAVPLDQAASRALFERALAGEVFPVFHEFGPVDGRRIYEMRFHPLRDRAGAITGAALVADDVTERTRQAATARFLAEVEQSIRRLDDPDEICQTVARLLCEHLRAGRCTYGEIDSDGDLYWRGGNYSRDLPTPAGPSRLSDHGQVIKAVLETGRTLVITNAETDGQIDEGAREVYRARGICASVSAPLRRQGRLFAMLAVHSATRRHWRGDEIELVESMAHRSAESIERARIARELRTADRRKDEFLATLAHELRNPLAPLSNALHLMRSAPFEVPAQPLTEMMARQVSQLVHLVDDLLDVSRITRGRVELKNDILDLADVLASAVETTRPLLDAAGHQLELQTCAERLLVRGDAMRLAQVFANLLNNAAKYTENGGRIVLSLRREGGSAVASIRDSGIGLEPHMLLRVFDIFAQVSDRTERTKGGLGIGLSLVKSLVQLHGGSVVAHSGGLGHGSEFAVTLPLVAAEVASAGSAVDARLPTTPAQRVLVVDDNRDAADSLCMLLNVMGMDVQVAYRAEEALAALPRYQPTTAVLDIGMPEMSGYQLARLIREHPLGRDIRLVALTGWGQEEDRRLAREAGFDRHLVKPVELADLASALVDPLPRPAA